MNATQKIPSVNEFIHAVEQFDSKCKEHKASEEDFKQFALIISKTPKADETVAKRLNILAKTLDSNKAILQSIVGFPLVKREVETHLDLYLKEEKEENAKVNSKGKKEGLSRN